MSVQAEGGSRCDVDEAAIVRSPVATAASAEASECEKEGRRWLEKYMEHVQRLQELKQHHVHLPNAETGEREPLTHCRRPDNLKACKADFPRSHWAVDKAVVLCPGLIRRFGMPLAGRRNKLGSMHGPLNNEWLNGTHPAMLAAQGFNSDVQLPYRFPITAETHSATECSEQCPHEVEEAVIVNAVQVAQDAQAGYACDYMNKRQPMAINEIKECCKGHASLATQVAGKGAPYVAKRHASRLMSDAYGKGIVRGQAENVNLRVNAREDDVTHAETLKTSTTDAFHGGEYIRVIERLNDHTDAKDRAIFTQIDGRNPKRKAVKFRDVAELYGQRPKHPDVWYLSPYEFVMAWYAKLVS